ncbi:hypothetical protein HK102_009356, partial [Quaeritorhiza haematococci]
MPSTSRGGVFGGYGGGGFKYTPLPVAVPPFSSATSVSASSSIYAEETNQTDFELTSSQHRRTQSHHDVVTTRQDRGHENHRGQDHVSAAFYPYLETGTSHLPRKVCTSKVYTGAHEENMDKYDHEEDHPNEEYNGRVDERGGGGGTTNNLDIGDVNPLYEKLLPVANEDAPIYVDPEDRPYRDVAFAIIFLLCFSAMMLTGLVLAFTTKPIPVSSSVFSTSVYAAVKGSAGLLFGITALSVIACGMWIYLLSRYVRQIVWLTVAIIPATCVFLFIAILSNSVIGKSQKNPTPPASLLPQYDWAISFAVGFLVSGLASGRFFLGKRRDIERTIHILRLACDVLRTNPTIVAVSLMLMGAYIAFVAIWVYFFTRLFLLGHLEARGGPSGGLDDTWIPDGGWTWAVAFFILMYLWTTSVFHNLEKTTIAGVVGEWYFTGDSSPSN